MKKSLYFILSDENLFHPHYLTGVFETLDERKYKIVGITIAEDAHKRGFGRFLYEQLILWGIVGFFFIAINTIIRQFLDRLPINNLSLRSIARSHKIPLIESLDVNSKEHRDYLKKIDVDIIISSQGQIFKKDLLGLPKIACINRHSALLPKYGGVLPVFWAMYFGEKEFGASVHYMVEEIDKGDILYQEKIPLHKHNSLFRNYLYAFDKSIETTIGALKNLEAKKVMIRYYYSERGYFSFPSHDKIREFKKQYKTFSFSDVFAFYTWHSN